MVRFKYMYYIHEHFYALGASICVCIMQKRRDFAEKESVKRKERIVPH